MTSRGLPCLLRMGRVGPATADEADVEVALVELELVDARGRVRRFLVPADRVVVPIEEPERTDATGPWGEGSATGDVVYLRAMLTGPYDGDAATFRVSTGRPDGIRSRDGRATFEVHPDQVEIGVR